MSSEVDTFGDEIQLTEPEDKGEKEKTATSNGNGTPSAEGQEPRVYANENMGSDEDAEDESEGVDDESEEDEDGDVPELPSAEEQKQAMSKLDSQCPMKEGDQWYLVHFRWWQLWKTYTDVCHNFFLFFPSSSSSHFLFSLLLQVINDSLIPSLSFVV